MAEELHISTGSKEDKYLALVPQIESVISDESDLIANLSNAMAMLWETFHHLWTGVYRVVGDELVLGPFQGPLACTRIRKGKGVCGKAFADAQTVVVPDVEQFPGHIACSSLSRSEIVVPVIKDGAVVAVIDIDSMSVGTFDHVDARYLEQIAQLLAKSF